MSVFIESVSVRDFAAAEVDDNNKQIGARSFHCDAHERYLAD